MRGAKLPGLRGKITNGLHLRIATARAISELEVYGKRSTTLPAGVASLTTFLTAAQNAINAIKLYPASVAITPAPITLSLAGTKTQQLVVTRTNLDATTTDVSLGSTGTVYTVVNGTGSGTCGVNGLVTGVTIGTFTVTARFNNKSQTRTYTVTA